MILTEHLYGVIDSTRLQEVWRCTKTACEVRDLQYAFASVVVAILDFTEVCNEVFQKLAPCYKVKLEVGANPKKVVRVPVNRFAKCSVGFPVVGIGL